MTILRKYTCIATQKYSVDYADDTELFVWADPDHVVNVFDILDRGGWAIVPNSEIFGTDEYENFDSELELGFIEIPEAE